MYKLKLTTVDKVLYRIFEGSRKLKEFEDADNRRNSKGYPKKASAKRSSLKAQVRKDINRIWDPNLASPTRYSDGSNFVLYTAEDQITSASEAGYHLSKLLGPALKNGEVKYIDRIVYDVKFIGLQEDYIGCVDELDKLTKDPPGGYDFCQKLADRAQKRGAQLLRVPSARNRDGICTPLLDVTSIKSSSNGKLVRFRVDGSLDEVEVSFSPSKTFMVPIARD